MSSGVWGVKGKVSGPGWGRLESYQYQTRCFGCGVLFVHRYECDWFCAGCEDKRRDKDGI